MCSYSVVSDSVAPVSLSPQALLSMAFSLQEYWIELPFPSPGNHPDLEMGPLSPTSPALAVRFFTTWEAHILHKSE